MSRAEAHSYVLAGAAVVVLGLWASSAAAEEATAPPSPPLRVTIVLADREAARPLEAQVHAYFADAAKKQGLAVDLDLGYDSDPRRKKLLDGWRQMVREEKRRNPRMPLEFPDGERSAGFLGPLLLVGEQKIRASLNDETLLRAQRMHAAQHGSRALPGGAGGGAAGPELPTGLGPSSPGRATGHPLSYPLAVILGLLLLGALWWTGTTETGRAGTAAARIGGGLDPKAGETGTRRSRPRRRRRR